MNRYFISLFLGLGLSSFIEASSQIDLPALIKKFTEATIAYQKSENK